MSKTKEAVGRIRDLPADELVQAIDKTRDELFRLKLASYTNQVQDTASIRTKRRELARILTIIGNRVNGREDQASKGGEATSESDAAPKATKAAPAQKAKAPAEKKAAKAPATAAKAKTSTKQKKEG